MRLTEILLVLLFFFLVDMLQGVNGKYQGKAKQRIPNEKKKKEYLAAFGTEETVKNVMANCKVHRWQTVVIMALMISMQLMMWIKWFGRCGFNFPFIPAAAQRERARPPYKQFNICSFCFSATVVVYRSVK